MFWSIDNDDFRGSCTGQKYPLIENAKAALYGNQIAAKSDGKSQPSSLLRRPANKGRVSATTQRSDTSNIPFSTPEPPTTPDSVVGKRIIHDYFP